MFGSYQGVFFSHILILSKDKQVLIPVTAEAYICFSFILFTPDSSPHKKSLCLCFLRFWFSGCY